MRGGCPAAISDREGLAPPMFTLGAVGVRAALVTRLHRVGAGIRGYRFGGRVQAVAVGLRLVQRHLHTFAGCCAVAVGLASDPTGRQPHGA